MKFENRNVNCVALTGRTFIDELATALAATHLNERLTGDQCQTATNPIVRVPGREVHFHSRNPRLNSSSDLR